MRSRAHLAIVASVATVTLIVATACGGNADPPIPGPDPGSVPTAAPLTSVPAAVVVTATPATSTPAPGGTQQTYTVESGDVLGSIAERFNVSSEAIRSLNQLTTDILQIDQELLIPAPAPDAPPPSTGAGITTYTVVEGDTPFGIALEFDTTVEALEAANGVAPGGLDLLQLGQVVKLPPPGQR